MHPHGWVRMHQIFRKMSFLLNRQGKWGEHIWENSIFSLSFFVPLRCFGSVCTVQPQTLWNFLQQTIFKCCKWICGYFYIYSTFRFNTRYIFSIKKILLQHSPLFGTTFILKILFIFLFLSRNCVYFIWQLWQFAKYYCAKHSACILCGSIS